VLRQRLSAPRTLRAPHHLDVELASTVRGLAARKKITDHRAEQMLADYSRLRITRHPVWPYHPRMWKLRHDLGAYDAAYIALAEALGCELLTGDIKLKKRRWAPCNRDRHPLAPSSRERVRACVPDDEQPAIQSEQPAHPPTPALGAGREGRFSSPASS
jgi:predicted nucleic acid-binding protein